MKILIAHNYYQQPGGEDVVFAAEAKLLEDRGHEVFRFTVCNDQISSMSRAALIGTALWNSRTHRELRELVLRHRIDVVHFHNTFPLISPSAYSAVRAAGAAVVQTLHNFRLLCPNGLLYRDGQVCQKCVGKLVALPGVVHGCYRNSRSATGTVALMLAIHRIARTWRRAVDLYIAPSPSAQRRLCDAGLPADRIIVKPHFVDPDPGPGLGQGGCALFVGRLSPEKGLETLLRAWAVLRHAPQLKIIGDGPLAGLVQQAVSSNIEWLGRQPPKAVCRIMGESAALILPSQCYETFGRVAAEAFAVGTPVIASDLGAMADMVEHGRTGLLFKAGDASELARQVESLFSDPDRMARMRQVVRCEYESKYNADTNYEQLIAIYQRALANRNGVEAPLHHHELGRRQPVGSASGGDADEARPAGHVLHP